MKYALIATETGAVLQWQDHARLGYAEPAKGQTLHKLPSTFQPPDAPMWLVDGKLTAEVPAREPAPLTTPSTVTMRQARLALLATGKLAAVGTAIKALPSPQKEAAQIEWDYSATVDRASPIVALLGPALSLDDAALDALFTAAAAL